MFSTKHDVVQYVDEKDKDGKVVAHKNLKEGDFHVKGTIESNGTRELSRDKAPITAQVVSLKRSAGGGIDYEFAISAVAGRRSAIGSSPTGKERRGVVVDDSAVAPAAAPAGAPPPYARKA
jgi:hypothetical protein